MPVEWKPSAIRCCPADETFESPRVESLRGRPPQRRRAKMILHHDFTHDRSFWHWSDRIKRLEHVPYDDDDSN